MGMDPAYRIREIQLIKIATILFFIWSLCLLLQFAAVKYDLLGARDPEDHNDPSVFALILVIIFLILLINPLRFMYRRLRLKTLLSLFKLLIIPMGKVSFATFFLADILTSFVKPMQDISISTCYLFTGKWLYNSSPDCTYLKPTGHIIAMLPFLLRALQCIRKLYDTGEKFPHLANTFKFLSVVLAVVFDMLQQYVGIGFYHWWILVYIVASCYCIVWDVTMDWGLCRWRREGELIQQFSFGGEMEVKPRRKFVLRDKLFFKRKVYYFAIVVNALLRCAWTFTLFSTAFLDETGLGNQFFIFGLSILEVYRRMQWTIIRFENENINNYEKYRNVLEIPELPEQDTVQSLKFINS
jgi:hypothetical protein